MIVQIHRLLADELVVELEKNRENKKLIRYILHKQQTFDNTECLLFLKNLVKNLTKKVDWSILTQPVKYYLFLHRVFCWQKGSLNYTE